MMNYHQAYHFYYDCIHFQILQKIPPTSIFTLQVRVLVDGIEAHTIAPQGDDEYIGLDDSETKEFCIR